MMGIGPRRALFGVVLVLLFSGGVAGLAAAAQTKELGKLRVGVLR